MLARFAGLIAVCVFVVPASADTPKKGATLVSAEGKLAVGGGSAGSGAAIVAGTGINAGEDAHAELDLGDARIAVAPQTVFHVFGSPAPKGSKKLVVSDSTLTSGVVRVSTSKATTINTPAGKVLLDAATDAKLHVDKGVTRVSVHKGSAKLGGVGIAEGFGLRVGKGKPAKLPDAPVWTAMPKSKLTTKGEVPAEVKAVLGGVATVWHVQVAMNATFTEFLTDAQLEAKTTTLVFEQKLTPGRYWVRISAIDAVGLEGPWSAVAPTEIISAKP